MKDSPHNYRGKRHQGFLVCLQDESEINMSPTTSDAEVVIPHHSLTGVFSGVEMFRGILSYLMALCCGCPRFIV
jgi:hypothetical protein